MNLQKLRALRQQASEFTGKWETDGGQIIIDDNHEFILRTATPRLAIYICMIHNTWIILTNCILLLRRALADQKAMSNVTRKDT